MVPFLTTHPRIYRAVGMAIACLCFTIALSADPVVITNDKISVHVAHMPLREFLGHIAQYGIEVRFDPSINQTVTSHFINRDIQTGLASLFKPLSYVFIWKRLNTDTGSLPVLSEIQIYKPGNKAAMKRLKQRRNLRIAHDPEGAYDYVSNEVIIRLKKGTDLGALHRLLAGVNGTIVDSHGIMGIYRIRLPDDIAVPAFVRRAETLPVISSVEPNFAYPIGRPAHLLGFGHKPSGAPSDRDVLKNAPIAVLDTGIDSTGHPSIHLIGSLDAVDPLSPMSDPLGHGTQMAYIASGLIRPDGTTGNNEAPIPVAPIRIFDDNGYTSNDTILRATDYAIAQGAAVMSLSWGSKTKSGFLEAILDYAAAKGIAVVASAGNEPTGEPVYPAAYSSVIGIGALTPDGNAWERSNYGDFVVVYAPGFASLPVGFKGDPGRYAGTSIAAAYTANRISHLLSLMPGRTSDNIDALLKELRPAD